MNKSENIPRRSAATITAIGLLLGAGLWAIRLARADHCFGSGDLLSVRKAIKLAPGNVDYILGLAELVDGSGEDPRPWLTAASNLNPYDASIRIDLGLLEEMEKQYQRAEAQFKTAARVNRKYAPRWALANYYFRRGEAGNFWQWIREAFLMSYGDRRSLFDLCWSMNSQPDTILRRAIPDQRSVKIDYVNYLFARQQFPSAEPLLLELAMSAEVPETSYFLGLIDKLLRHGRIPSAVAAWNSLCRKGLLRYSPLDPGAGAILTNSNFTYPILGQGFDWLFSRTAGVAITQIPPPAGLKISLSGDQAEQCEILSQYLPLESGRRYRLKYRYRSTPSPMSMSNPDTGIHWKLYTASGKIEAARSDPLAWDGTAEDSFVFILPEDNTGARLTLAYERASGTTRTEGVITLENLRIEVVE